MELLSGFHDYSLSIIIMILFFVGGATYLVITNRFISGAALERSVEIIWTVVPMFILIILAVPSLRILYFIEEGKIQPRVVVKVIGHQWYWNYRFLDGEFDSYKGRDQYRLLDVDNRLVLPTRRIRALISAEDVLHRWAVPALGVKADAVPGRLNSLNFNIIRSSILYGQCSEICGANHSFMPITVEAISNENFKKWALDLFNDWQYTLILQKFSFAMKEYRIPITAI